MLNKVTPVVAGGTDGGAEDESAVATATSASDGTEIRPAEGTGGGTAATTDAAVQQEERARLAGDEEKEEAMAAARLCWEASLTDAAAKWSTDKGKQEEAELALAAAIKKRMGFEDEAEFRECRRLGFPTKAEYDECKRLGFEMSFEGKDEFIFSYKRLGFESKADFDAYKTNGDLEALKGLGCGSKAEFDECRASGDLEQLKGMGFKKKSDFDECRRKGFGTKAEYDEAKKADKAREKQEAAAAEAAVREAAKARLAEGYTEAKLKHTNSEDSEILDKVKKEEFWEQVKASPTTMTPEQLALLKAARQALADEYLALPKEEQEAMQFQQVYPGLEEYNPYYASLNAALADGTTALLRADFLERLAAEGRPLGHRAELPPEAFYEGPIWAEGNNKGVIIVGLSYMWATADHPDPDGEQLRDVAKYLRWLQEAGGLGTNHKGKLVAVFWDWASLYQDKPFFDPRRTEEQTRMFKSGLQNVNLWYCHPNTLTLMNRKTPAGRQWSYDDSGWPVSVREMRGLVWGHFRRCAARSLSYFLSSLLCHDGCVCSFLFLFPSDATTTTTQLHRMQLFERAVSQFVKDELGVMDLHSVLETLADEEVEDEDVKNDFFDMASACGERFKPAPPLAPVAMSLKLAVAHFTNGADVAFVQGKYEATFLLVLGKAKQLSFEGMGWVTEEQWAAFCLEVLPQCASLEELYLGGNANLKVDIVELVAKLPPTLKTLSLYNTGCFGDAGKADWARLPALEGVGLSGTKVTGSEEDLKAAGCAAGYIYI